MQPFRKLVWAALPFIAACSSVDVRTDYDHGLDFSRYSTYFWKSLPETPNPLMKDRIVAAVDRQLRSKGWRKVAEEHADTAIVAQVTSHRDQRVNTYYGNRGPGWYGPGVGMWGGAGMATSTVSSYTVGTLVIDLFDVKAKKAIWRGTASGIVSDNPEENRKALDEGVREMFAKFPPLRTTTMH